MIYAALRQSARRGAEGRDIVSLIVNARGRGNGALHDSACGWPGGRLGH